MSLDVYLKVKGETVFNSNITHNLGAMAGACGVYYACWRPEEINCKRARHILPMLQDGVNVLKKDKEHYKRFDCANGWGTYGDFLPWLEEYRDACEKYPDAKIRVSRQL